MVDLNVTAEEFIRPATFVMAALMASGQRISLTPIALGYIYHGLGEASSHPDHHNLSHPLCNRLSYFLLHIVAAQIVTVLMIFLVLFIMQAFLVVNLHYPKLDMFLGMGGIFLSELALIMRTLVIAEIYGNRSTKEKPLVSSSEKGKAKLSTIEICYLSSKIKKIFGVVETSIKIEDLVDVDHVKVLSDQDLTCSSKIAHIEDQLNNLSSKASTLKVKEQDVLREDERIRKIREDLTIQQQVLLEVEGKLKFSLDLKKKEAEQVKADLAEAGFSKLQDLEKKKNHLKSLIGSIISFNNI
ncbi:LOW QUALITY PROTEIN: hypothetical protein Cgig2_030698 [Carnegiea gigantea]|uniref:Uncharacterized protein n=1 Tax=Carnegiea gigantea TaxID=171969 RepID=A0A9Q1GYC9_9CARY|nr:LOW QUALITY PROTEIN: hypothetical protein Cgig2_030698 [Carnegiea gigantea]